MTTPKIIKQQFSARLREDDIEIISDAIPEIFPDVADLETLSGREILRGSVEKAVMTVRKSKESNPDDTKKIEELGLQVKYLVGELETEQGNVSGLQQKLYERSDECVGLQEEIQRLKTLLEEKEGNVKSLEKFKPIENEIRGQLPELTKVLLIMYARKVSAIAKKEIRPFDILISLFNRYLTKKEVEFEGFPFVISDAEIRKAKTEIDGKKSVE